MELILNIWLIGVIPKDHMTDQPYLGSGTYNGIQGWYFTKTDNVNWSVKEKKTIREILKKKGYKCKGIDDYEIEWDGDRSYSPSISFILKQLIMENRGRPSENTVKPR